MQGKQTNYDGDLKAAKKKNPSKLALEQCFVVLIMIVKMKVMADDIWWWNQSGD